MNDGRARQWIIGACTAAVLVLAALGALLWFFLDEGRDNSDKWASIIGLPLATASAVAPLLVWMVRQGRTARPDRDETALLSRLRHAVDRMWAEEITAQQAYLPQPLRLQWNVSPDPEIQVGRRASSMALRGRLLVDDDAEQPAAAAALFKLFQSPEMRQLVVLGEPGAGKTTLATLFVVAGAATGRQDDPVPVLMPIAEWDPARGDGIEDWIAERLGEDFTQLSAAECAWLVAKRKILPVLDGLDEIPEAAREAALAQLEKAAKARLRIMITCRQDEYKQVTAEAGPLPQAHVITVAPVSARDAADYLAERESRASKRWDAVLKAMSGAPEGALATALSTPLMISLARQVYQSPRTNPSDLVGLPSVDAIRQRVLGLFLPSVYGRDREAKLARRWLGTLVDHLPDHDQDPNLRWWRLAGAIPRRTLVALVTALSTVLGGLVGAVDSAVMHYGELIEGRLVEDIFVGAAIGFSLGLLAGMHAARSACAFTKPPPSASTKPADRGAAWFFAIGTGLGEAYAAVAVLSAFAALTLLGMHGIATPTAATLSSTVADVFRSLRSSDPQVIGPTTLIASFVLLTVVIVNGLGAGRAGSPRQSAPRLGSLPRHLMSALGVGLLAALPWAVTDAFGLLGMDLGPALLVAAAIGGFVAVPLGLGRWLSSPVPDAENNSSPRSALRSDRNALLLTAGGVSVTSGLMVSAIYFWIAGGPATRNLIVAGISAGVAIGALVLLGSGAAWLSYTVARLWLALRGRLPWRLMRFLRDAHHKGVLRQAGSAYQIRHDLLSRYLKSNPVPAGAADPKPARRGSAVRRWLAVLLSATLGIGSLPAASFYVAIPLGLATLGAGAAVRIGYGGGDLPGWNTIPGGFDVELGRFLQDSFGWAEIRWVPLQQEDRLLYLENHSVDLVISTFSITQSRVHLIDMAGPYFLDHASTAINRKKLVQQAARGSIDLCTTGNARGSAEEVLRREWPGLVREASVNVSYGRSLAACEADLRRADQGPSAVLSDWSILKSFDDSEILLAPERPGEALELYGIGMIDNSGDVCLAITQKLDEFLVSGSWQATFERSLQPFGLTPDLHRPATADPALCAR